MKAVSGASSRAGASVFSANVVAVVFVVSIILSLVLPKDMDIKRVEEK